MKRLTSILAAMMMAAAAFTLTGCDEDDDIASTLWGVWEGDMYVSSYYGGDYYDASYSEIAFDKDPYDYASGTGYWIDYYSNAPWDYHANHIQWYVNNGVISINFIEDGGSVDIYDYSLNSNYFTGVIYNDYGEALNFRLTKTAAPDWGDYEWGWDYGYGYNAPSYSKQKGIVTNKEKAAPVRHFGRKATSKADARQ